MSDKIYSELDPVFETFGLLSISNHFDEVRQETKKALSDFGINGEQFYFQNLKVFDKYVQSFLKYRVSGQNDELFFEEKDINYSVILLYLVNEYKSSLTLADDVTDQLINTEIIRICEAVFDNIRKSGRVDTLEDIILFIENSGLEGTAKWKLMSIMKQPKKHVLQLIDTIHVNMEAFNKAVSAIRQPLSKLLDQYNASQKNQSDKMFFEMKNKLSQASNIYPTLIFPVSQIMFEESCYYGLLSQEVIKQGQGHLYSKESLLLKLKALSDSSKLEILISLKSSPKYNLEIAQQMGLTPATMSHHMSVLLNCGFVDVEKRDGKVYYHIKEENIKGMIEDMEQTLL